MISGQADSSYKRLMRTIAVPAGGATLSFWVTRDTEQTWDFVFVEAHTVGADDWTTLPDAERPHERRHRQLVPARELAADPPVPRALPDRQRRRHVHADRHDRRVVGGERPERRLGAVEGRPRRLRGQASRGLDHATPVTTSSRPTACSSTTSRRPTGEGTTSFEDDGDTLDGWTVPGAPAGSPGNAERLDRRHRRRPAADARRRRARVVRARARDHRVPRPTTSARIRSATPAGSSTTCRASASRSRTRPGRSTRRSSSTTRSAATASSSTSSRTSGTATAWRVAPLAATSGSTRASRPTPSGSGASTRASRRRRRSSTTRTRRSPRTTRSGSSSIGDPGPDDLFDEPVYARGAMTLQELRIAVGDDAFFRILRKWASTQRGGNGSDGRVHRAGRAHLRPGSRRALRRPGCSPPAKPDVPAPVAATALGSQALTSAFAGGRTAHAALHASVARSLRR